MTRTKMGAQPYDPSPDGKNIPFLLGADLFVVSRFPPHEVRPLVKSPAIEARVVFHPNGGWIAYQATDSGRYEIYVRPFFDTDRSRWTVSTEGGEQPLWSPRGDELFYVNGKNQLVSVQIGGGETFTQGKSTVIFPDAGPRTAAVRNYDIQPRRLALSDGQGIGGRSDAANRRRRALARRGDTQSTLTGQAPFVVLVGAAMPSVLAEISFITNPQEAKLLEQNAYSSTGRAGVPRR